MDKKRYKKTRYQNIFKNIKNGNYIVRISNPDTTISRDKDNKKIYDINIAKDIRDNKTNRIIKIQQINNKDVFEKIWKMYIDECKMNLAYKTYRKKEKMYDRFISNYFSDLKLSKITKDEMKKFINQVNTTDKQKNELIKQLRAFFSWCIKNDLLFFNPAQQIEKYKVVKSEMKYWLPEHINQILNCLDYEISNNTNKAFAYLIKMFIIISFNLGARTGEVRALRFKDIDYTYNTVSIKHSFDENPNNDTHLKDTKNLHSNRKIYVSDKFINEITKYKYFLQNELKKNIDDNSIILVSPRTNKPYSDTTLRRYFYYYIKKSKVPYIRMYDLRHTFVTLMMSEGYDIYAISKRIGHNNINTTVNVYGHLNDKIKKEMALVTDKYF